MAADFERAMLARMDAQREAWVDLGGGLRLKYLRPREGQLHSFISGVKLEHVVQYACGWQGFTEATLLGPSVGGSDEIPFSRELFAAYIEDHVKELQTVCEAMAQTVTVYLQRKADVAKNSPASST